MHRTFELAKILKRGTGDDKMSGFNKTLMILSIVFGVMMLPAGYFLDTIPTFVPDPVAFLQTLFAGGFIVSIIILIPFILDTMYMSNDLPVLLTFPYTYNEIVWAKIINVSSVAVVVCIVCALPCGLAYGIARGAGLIFYLAILLATISLPIITISLIGGVMVIIMYFVHSLRNKDVLRVIGAILGFAFIVGMVLFANMGNTSASAIAKTFEGLSKASNVFPVNFALGRMLRGDSNPILILAVILITAIFLGVFILLTGRLYINGALAMQETSSQVVELDDEAYKKNCKKKSVLKAYMIRDLKLIKRNPAYLTKGFLLTIIYPAVVIIMYLFSSTYSDLFGLDTLKNNMAILGWTFGMSSLITIIGSSTNAVACTPISREGEDFMLLKQTPVDFRIVLRAKQLAALFICALGSVTYMVIGGLVLVAIGVLPLWDVLYALAICVGMLFFCVNINMLSDIKKPSLVWESEADMLNKKVSAASLVLLLVGVTLGVVLITIIGALPETLFYPILLGTLVFIFLLAFISSRVLFGKGMKKFSRL